LVNQPYAHLRPPLQRVYRAYLHGQLELRQPSTSQGNETFTSALAVHSQAQNIPPEAIPFPSSEADTPKSRQPLFTLAQVMTFFIFFTILAAALLMGLFFARGVK